MEEYNQESERLTPHATENQEQDAAEWMIEYVDSLFDKVAPTLAVLHAHNASIAKEREETKGLHSLIDRYFDENQQLRAQLEKEREQYDKLLSTTGEAEELVKLRTQLAAAQAAIIEPCSIHMASSRACERGTKSCVVYHTRIGGDTSALDAAIEEAVKKWTSERCFVTLEAYERLEQAQKPLVDALTKFRTLLESCPIVCLGTGQASDGMTWPMRDEVIDGINAVLAQYKKKP